MSKANSADVQAIIGNASSGVVTIERRKGKDRRAGVDRRNCSIPVTLDRRDGDDRRSGFDRRAKGLEPLEARSLFSAVSFEAGILMIRGDESSANEITVNLKKNQIVAQVGECIRDMHRRGVSVVLVEQKLAIALKVSSRVCLVGHGRIVFEGSPEQLQSDAALLAQWLAV